MTSLWRLGMSLTLLLAVVTGHVLGKRVGLTEAAVPAYADTSLRSGEELVLIYVGAEHCGFAQMPELPPALEEATERLRALATKKGLFLTTVGVAIDWDIEQGMAHLREVGLQWDEVVLGRNWMNSVLVEYVWVDEEAIVGTPTLIVARRVTEGPSLTDSETRFRVLSLDVLQRHNGVREIGDFARRADELVEAALEELGQ